MSDYVSLLRSLVPDADYATSRLERPVMQDVGPPMTYECCGHFQTRRMMFKLGVSLGTSLQQKVCAILRICSHQRPTVERVSEVTF